MYALVIIEMHCSKSFLFTLFLFFMVSITMFYLSLLSREQQQQQESLVHINKETKQLPSHRDPLLQTFYQPHQRFFFEDMAQLNTKEKKAVAQCYIDHCTEEGAKKSGNYENHSTSKQKGCSNYDYQDISVFQAFFLEPLYIGGVFVEIGAMTGWGASNTLFFEHCLNWTGALFDVSPDNHQQMVKNRVSATTHKVLGTVCEPPQKHVRISANMAGCCGKVSVGDMVESQTTTSKKDGADMVDIPCKPMSQWLRELGISRIDYFSLDTEGYEYEVLRTIDWSFNSVRVISVEMLDRSLVDQQEFDNQKRIRDLLSGVGLIYVPWLSSTRGALNNDEFWVNFSWTL